MSDSVLHFVPRSELESHENLSAFIEVCQKSEVLNAKTQWNKNVWDAGYQKGRNGLLRAVFSTLEASEKNSALPPFPDPFLDFAKAILVYMQDRRPIVSQGTHRIAALRCLEAALREWSKDSRPTAVNADVLDTAVEFARNRLSPDGAYRVAGQLEVIADLMNTHGFITLRQEWRHGLKKPSALGSRISQEALRARQEKLPSAAALRALAGIFRDALKPMDILVSSYTALMLCAPERINEVLRVRRNCVVEGDSRFSGEVGLRWPGSKGAQDATKWIPTQMKEVAKESVSNLLKVSASAHEIAKWYTENPNTLFLHESALHLREQEVLSAADVALVLWGDDSSTDSAHAWARKTNKLTPVPIGGKKMGYRFKDVGDAVIGMLPTTFPYTPGAPNLLCKDALGVIRMNESHEGKKIYLCMFRCVDAQVLTRNFGGRNGVKSIFERFKYEEDDGSRIRLKSHSLRHWLNMLAQMGGMSDAEIAIFSGRKDVQQNRAYDHRSSDEVQAPIKQALKTGFTGNLLVAGTRVLVSRSEFGGLGVVAAHTTDFGWCTHNFASEPCQMYRDCINCEEQECVKGETNKESSLRLLEKEIKYLLEQAKQALTQQEYGADSWVVHHIGTLNRVEALLKIIDDPSIPKGARIRLDLVNAPLVTAGSLQVTNVVKPVESGTKIKRS